MVQSIPKPFNLILLLGVIAFVVSPVAASIDLFWNPAFNTGLQSTEGLEGGLDYSHYNSSIQIQDIVAPNTTPWEMWIGSGLLGIGLLLLALFLTMRSNVGIPEHERGIILCVLSILPLGFCSFASFAIDRITGFGVTSQIVNTTAIVPQGSINNHEYVYMENHLIYSEPLVGLMMVVLVFVAIGLAFYFMSTHKVLRGEEGRKFE